jgi:hypothetical protein
MRPVPSAENQRRALFGEDYIRSLMNRTNDPTVDELLKMSDADRLLALDQMSDTAVRHLVRALTKDDAEDEEDDDREADEDNKKIDDEDDAEDEEDDDRMLSLLTQMSDDDRLWALDLLSDDVVRRLHDRGWG